MHLKNDLDKYGVGGLGPIGMLKVFHFEHEIPSNVKYSALLRRTKWIDTVMKQFYYSGLTEIHKFTIQENGAERNADHGDAGRHAQALDWMVKQATAAGVPIQ